MITATRRGIPFFKPPYVGVRGWVGIELGQIRDADLRFFIRTAWELIAPKRLLSQIDRLHRPRAKRSPSRSG